MRSSRNRYMLPSDRFPGYEIRVACGGYDKNLSYLITHKNSGNQWLVDPALAPETFSSLSPRNLSILITHSHGDHIRYLDQYLSIAPGVTIYGPSPNLRDYPVSPLRDGDIIPVGEDEIKVLSTPGHYPDSLSFCFRTSVFTGDTLFVGRTGRAVDPRSNLAQLYQSVYFKLLTLPPDTLILPGHDYGAKPWITMKENIACSPLLQARDESDFRHRMAVFEASRTP